LNSKIIGVIIIIIAIGGSSAYFMTKDETPDVNSSVNLTTNDTFYQNDKIGLAINTIHPPEGILDIEESYKIAHSSGIGRTNLYIHWDYLEPEKDNFDWRMTDILMKLNEKYNLKTTLYFSVINADRLGPFPLWMGNQVIGKSLENDTIRVLNQILDRYENIDYVIFAADIDYHFQRATGTIPTFVEFFNNVSTKVKVNHPNVKIGNSLSLENIINKDLVPNGTFELTPKLVMGDFIALSYKPTDVIGDINRTPQESINEFEKALEIFPSQKLAFFDVSWSTSEFIYGNSRDQEEFVKSSLNFFDENESQIEFFTVSRLFDKPKGSCVSLDVENISGSGFASNSFRLERIDEYLCNSGLIDLNSDAKSAWKQFKTNIPQ